MRSSLRALAGPALLALAAWIAAGTIAPASPASSTVRVAMFGSAIVPFLVFAAALAFPALRRWPALATPACLAVVPWLPLPIPQIALLWTGRLAWIPIAIPFLAAGWLHGTSWVRQGRAGMTPRGHLVASFALTLVLSAGTAYSLRWSLPAGDEPHYLVITQSLLEDHDLRIENNHANRGYRAYYEQTIDPQSLRRGLDGQIYPVHMPGVSVLVLPLFAAFGYLGAQATIVLMAGLAGALVWWIGWRTSGHLGGAWFGWAAIAGSATFLTESVTIFPDMPGALACAIAVLAAVSLSTEQRPRVATIVIASSALAVLPFLHTRFAMLSAGVGLVLLIRLLRLRPTTTHVLRDGALWAFVAPAAIGLVAWPAYFRVIYGSFDPRSPYGTAPETSLLNIPGGLFGLAFDQQFGLLAYSPVLALAAWCVFERRGRGAPLPAGPVAGLSTGVAAGLLAAGLAYAAGVATYWMWWAGGPAAPARFLTAALPLFAPALSMLWVPATKEQRGLLGAVLVASVAISAVTVFGGDGSLFANERDGRALWLDWTQSVLDLPRLWPSFFLELDPATRWSQWPFASHALIWLATFTIGGWWLWRRFARSENASGVVFPLVLASWWIPLSLMMADWVSVATRGTPPLRPILSQLEILSRVRHHEPGVVIQTGSISGLSAVTPMRLRVPRVEAPDAARAEWLVLPEVPAGRYRLTIQLKRPIEGGVLEVRQGRTPEPLSTLQLSRQSAQTFEITLAGDTRALWLVPNEVLGTTGAEIDLTPRLPG